VTKSEELKPTLEAALAHDGPALVDVLVHRQELSMPPTIFGSQALGFGLYLTKSILNGRGDAIIDFG
jgi:pyruvate dehydrogenase (quinone)